MKLFSCSTKKYHITEFLKSHFKVNIQFSLSVLNNENRVFQGKGFPLSTSLFIFVLLSFEPGSSLSLFALVLFHKCAHEVIHSQVSSDLAEVQHPDTNSL